MSEIFLSVSSNAGLCLVCGMPANDRPTLPSPQPLPEAFGRPDQTDQNHKGSKGESPPEKKPFWHRPVLLSVMIGIALVLIIAGTLYVIHLSHFESTDDAFIDGRIARIAPRVAGKVLSLNVTDNQIVSADQTLLVIDPAPYEVKLKQAIAGEGQAQAQQEQASANLEVAKANADQADADVVVAQANSLNAKQDFDRFTKLPPAARSQQQLDLATANQRSTIAQVTAAQKKADSMHAQVKSAQKTVDAADASVQAAKAMVEQAQLDLSYTKVVAGHAGRVTRRTVEIGNYVAVGQELLDVVPTDVPDDLWVTANFKENQLKHMERGQSVTITVDAFPDDKLHGHIDSIQNGTGAVFSLLPPENATGNYVKVVQRVPVKIILDEQPRHLLSPGLSVEPEVDVRDYHQDGDSNTANASNPPGH
jgi:membrane fusion protein, multidrug efflux system